MPDLPTIPTLIAAAKASAAKVIGADRQDANLHGPHTVPCLELARGLEAAALASEQLLAELQELRALVTLATTPEVRPPCIECGLREDEVERLQRELDEARELGSLAAKGAALELSQLRADLKEARADGVAAFRCFVDRAYGGDLKLEHDTHARLAALT